MTAVIGILNKNGVALAADSAVTVTGGNQKKIYNTANKLFTLSKYHPVGVMIYDSSTFMGTPWETLIKLYREQLKENSFDTIKDYKEDFVKFLKDNNHFTSSKEQLFQLKQFFYWRFKMIKDSIANKLTQGKTEPELLEEFNEKLDSQLDSDIASYVGATNVLVEFNGYTLDQFKTYCEKEINEVLDLVYDGIEITQEIKNKHVELYYQQLRTENFNGSQTGIVFAGFGDKEIFPALDSIKVAEAFDSKLRYYQDLTSIISLDNNGAIMPFAQTDVINMFIRGIDPSMYSLYLQVFEDLIKEYTDIIASILDGGDKTLADKVRAVKTSDLKKKFHERLKEVQREKQIQPTIDTVAILSKEDLSEMAESLIYLTYLKRRISSEDESVGGPIDVAIISKGDGFIWKKRKHYFTEELNKHFSQNYFK